MLDASVRCLGVGFSVERRGFISVFVRYVQVAFFWLWFKFCIHTPTGRGVAGCAAVLWGFGFYFYVQ